jgi:hypothetical protein
MVRVEADGVLHAQHMDGETVRMVHDGHTVSLAHGEEDTHRGWHAPAYGTLLPAWNADVSVSGELPLSLTTWIETGRHGAALRLHRMATDAATSDDPGAESSTVAVRVEGDEGTSVVMLRLGVPPRYVAQGRRVGDYQTDGRFLHIRQQGDRLVALDMIDARHALALRDGWLSVTSDTVIPDLHIRIDGGLLDLQATAPPDHLHLDGDLAEQATLLRLNGREVAAPTFRSTGVRTGAGLDIRGRQWPGQERACETSPDDASAAGPAFAVGSAPLPDPAVVATVPPVDPLPSPLA